MNLLAIMRQERYRKRLTPIPFFFTFANACLGFLAIIKSLEGEYSAAVYCIVAAAFMDVFDGRLARALGTTSMIGVELDSLVDGISFCLAPAVIFYTAYPYDMNAIHFATLLAYVCAGLYRLAKFNVHTGPSHLYFSGLPTPMAAFSVISLVLHQDWLLAHSGHFIFLQHLPFCFIGLVALLMISPVPFKKHSAFSPGEVAIIICTTSMGSAIAGKFGYPWLLLGIIAYIMAALMCYGYYALARSKS